MSDLVPVIIDGKVIGFQWEHIWFVDPKGYNQVDTFTQEYRKAGGLEGYMDRTPGPDNIIDFWDREIECLVNL